MLRRGFSFRSRAPKAGVAAHPASIAPTAMDAAEADGAAFLAVQPIGLTSPGGWRMPRVTKKRIALALGLLMFMALGSAYTQKDTLSPKVADYSRNVIGDENTAKVESYFFRISDKVDKLKYKILGGETNPFTSGVTVEFVSLPKGKVFVYYTGDGKTPSSSQLTVDSLAPLPLQFPKTVSLRDDPQPGEGVWSTAGLPHNTPTDTLMAKTFVRPDKSRPYAVVGALLIDSRRIRLHMTAGVVDPGGFRGVKGPGVIPTDALSGLLAAWNGGFKGPHGSFGMYADGTEYVPLRNGLATICVSKDGALKMGEWGNDI
ncbi:MAG: hypothetical protein ABI305_10450, partial [Tepidiformaceae bacterium]